MMLQQTPDSSESLDHPNKLLLLELARQFFAEVENLSVVLDL